MTNTDRALTTLRVSRDHQSGCVLNDAEVRALLSHLDARAAEIERLREDAERLDWLAEQLQDVQIGDTDPTAHYFDNETDVPWPVLWRRAIDYARSKE